MILVVLDDKLNGDLVVVEVKLNPVTSLLSPISDIGLVFLLSFNEKLNILLVILLSESDKFLLV